MNSSEGIFLGALVLINKGLQTPFVSTGTEVAFSIIFLKVFCSKCLILPFMSVKVLWTVSVSRFSVDITGLRMLLLLVSSLLPFNTQMLQSTVRCNFIRSVKNFLNETKTISWLLTSMTNESWYFPKEKTANSAIWIIGHYAEVHATEITPRKGYQNGVFP